MSQRPIVAIIGRPNVGKSSLFNRLLGYRQAIVSPVSGTTRDRLYAPVKLGNFVVDLVDTAGLSGDLATETFGQEMLDQIQQAVVEADVLIFVLDAKAGLTHEDKMLAEIIRKAQTSTVVYINKVDNPEVGPDLDLLQLGLGSTVSGSVSQRRGIDELVNILTSILPSELVYELTSQQVNSLPSVALIGRPNVGKSSLFNALVNDERVIVSDVPGTTRDAIDSKVEVEGGQSFIIVDTAGLRRRGKIGTRDNVERYSIMRTLRAVDRCDLAIIVVDAAEGLTRGDVHAAMYALEQKKRFITVFNKSDLIDPRTTNAQRFPFIARQPMIFVSAKEKVAIDQLHELIQTALHSAAERLNQNSEVEKLPTTPDQ